MPASFIDTNVLIYLLSVESARTARAEALVREGGTISGQVLDELANVTRRKFGFAWEEVADFLDGLRALLNVVPLDANVHEQGLRVAQRYNLSIMTDDRRCRANGRMQNPVVGGHASWPGYRWPDGNKNPFG